MTGIRMAAVSAGNLWSYLEEKLPDAAEFGVKIVLALVIFLIASRIIQWGTNCFRRYLLRLNVAVGAVTFGCSVLRFALYAGLVLILAQRLGVRQTSVAALVGTAGVTVGLALQGGLSNVAGGMIILIFKPFEVGDYIICQEAGFEGLVQKIELFYTTLETTGHQKTVVPNSILTSNPLVNETVKGMRQVEIEVGISYDSDIAKAKKVLLKIIKEDPLGKKDPEPFVFVSELGESAVILGIRLRVNGDYAIETRWRLNEKIKETFDREGIKIPFAQMDVHVYDTH